jgi:hypothetical protein
MKLQLYILEKKDKMQKIIMTPDNHDEIFAKIRSGKIAGAAVIMTPGEHKSEIKFTYHLLAKHRFMMKCKKRGIIIYFTKLKEIKC